MGEYERTGKGGGGCRFLKLIYSPYSYKLYFSGKGGGGGGCTIVASMD